MFAVQEYSSVVNYLLDDDFLRAAVCLAWVSYTDVFFYARRWALPRPRGSPAQMTEARSQPDPGVTRGPTPGTQAPRLPPASEMLHPCLCRAGTWALQPALGLDRKTAEGAEGRLGHGGRALELPEAVQAGAPDRTRLLAVHILRPCTPAPALRPHEGPLHAGPRPARSVWGRWATPANIPPLQRKSTFISFSFSNSMKLFEIHIYR